MSLYSENVIPGDHGKIFETDATKTEDLEKITQAILSIPGIRDVLVNPETYPREITVLTDSLVKISDVQTAANQEGFHVIARSLFHL